MEEGPGRVRGRLPVALRALSTPCSIAVSMVALRSLMKSPGVTEAAGVGENCKVGVMIGMPLAEDEGPLTDGMVIVDIEPPLAAVAVDTMGDGLVVEDAPGAMLIIIMDRRATTNLHRRSQLYVNDLLSTSWKKSVVRDVTARVVAFAEAYN